MPLGLVRDDLTRMGTDAVVTAADGTFLAGGGVDGQICRAAGPELLEARRRLGGCGTGQAKITGGYRLPAKYVIHTVGPVWRGGGHGEADLLASCYRMSMELAVENGCESIAFPLISAGAFGFPPDRALRTAVDAVRDFLSERDLTVWLVLFGRDAVLSGRALFPDLAERIDDAWADAHTDLSVERRRRALFRWLSRESAPADGAAPLGKTVPTEDAAPMYGAVPTEDAAPVDGAVPMEDAAPVDRAAVSMEEAVPMERADAALPAPMSAASMRASAPPLSAGSLDEALRALDEGFSRTLLRKIDERGMTDAQCYRKANVDRRHFSKIRSDPAYRPSKGTVLSFAVALGLSLEETRDLLARAGFALSRSSKADIIVEYFIQRGEYDVFRINEALFAFDQPLLGV